MLLLIRLLKRLRPDRVLRRLLLILRLRVGLGLLGLWLRRSCLVRRTLILRILIIRLFVVRSPVESLLWQGFRLRLPWSLLWILSRLLLHDSTRSLRQWTDSKVRQVYGRREFPRNIGGQVAGHARPPADAAPLVPPRYSIRNPSGRIIRHSDEQAGVVMATAAAAVPTRAAITGRFGTTATWASRTRRGT